MSAAKARLRWDGSQWRGLAKVKAHSGFKPPSQIADEVAAMIMSHGLTDVVMIGTTPGRQGISKCYQWMVGSQLLWYAEQLRFKALHGRFPYYARDGGQV